MRGDHDEVGTLMLGEVDNVMRWMTDLHMRLHRYPGPACLVRHLFEGSAGRARDIRNLNEWGSMP